MRRGTGGKERGREGRGGIRKAADKRRERGKEGKGGDDGREIRKEFTADS